MLFENLEIENSELIEIPITDQSLSEFPFPQNLSTVEGGYIKGIVSYNVNDIAKSTSGKTVVAAAAHNNACIVLRKKESGRDDINRFPLQDLRRSANAGVVTKFKAMQIDFSQSKIVLGDTTGLVTGQVFLLMVIYEKK